LIDVVMFITRALNIRLWLCMAVWLQVKVCVWVWAVAYTERLHCLLCTAS